MTTAVLAQQREPATSGLGRGLLLLMAVSTGLSVAGNYFAQPLLDLIARELQLGPTMAGLVVTAAQGGYALGLILLVPLGDLVERRGLAVVLFAATALFLTVTASAPGGPVLLIGTVLTALTSVAAQVVVPFAVSLSAPAERGRVVATVMTGLLLGSMIARTAAGALSELGGWRTVYWVQAVLMAIMALLLRKYLPQLRTSAELPYPTLLRSTLALFAQEALLRWRAAMGALSLAAAMSLWTALTFLLAAPPYEWSEATIGVFTLVGVTGALITTVTGRLADRGHVQAVSGVSAVLLLVSWLPIAAGSDSLLWLVVGVVALSMAQQATLNSNQNVVYTLRPEARNRINSAYMTAYFAGGATGSALTSVVWTHFGWTGVSVLGATLSAATAVLWILERLSQRRTISPNPARSAA
jgi:predicted MFS family arabinose efflux permease